MNVQVFRQRSLLPSMTCMFNSSRTFFDRKTRKFFELKTEEEPEHFSSTQPDPLADIEKRVQESKTKLKWRKPYSQQETFLTTSLRFFAPERTKQFFQILQRPLDFESMREALQLKQKELHALEQRFIPDRHRILGNDLAAAHFLVARGAQVR